MNAGHPDRERRATRTGRRTQARPDNEGTRRREWIVKRLKNLDVGRIWDRLSEARRAWRELRRTQHPSVGKLPVFVVGSNRSGTNMVCAALGKSPHGWAYQESEFSLAFSAYHLRSDWVVKWLIDRTPAPLVSFGSILDSQFTDELLSRFDGSRAIWVYRRFEDVANSCARMNWGPSLKDLVRWTARGEVDRLGARGRRITASTVGLFDDLYREDLSVEGAACLYWYMRNQIFFDLRLDEDPRVLIVQYEDTVQNPTRAFRRIFRFLDLPYDPSVTEHVYASSVGKHPWPGVDPAVENVCGELQGRLDAEYAGSSAWSPPQVPSSAGAAAPDAGLSASRGGEGRT